MKKSPDTSWMTSVSHLTYYSTLKLVQKREIPQSECLSFLNYSNRSLDYVRDDNYLLNAVATSTAQATLNLPLGCYRYRGIPSAVVYFPLQQFKEHGAMPSIHLDMMKLEGDRKRGLEQSFTVLAPHYHWIAELVSVLIYYAIKFSLYHC